MSEDTPPYAARTFTCPRCLTPFTPTADELQELEALELLVGLGSWRDADKVVGWCAECAADEQGKGRVQ